MAEKIIDISQLQQDDKNFNKHTEFGMSLLEKSVSKFGMGRSILIDKNNKIIAGNGIAETAGSVGIERVKVIETDGKEIIAVKRNDIDLDTDEGREMALADNATNAANLKWDRDNLNKAEEEFNIKKEEWGIEMKVLGAVFEKESEAQAATVEFPITILNSREEYEMFISVRDMLGLGSNAETFAFIMNEFYKKIEKR